MGGGFESVGVVERMYVSEWNGEGDVWLWGGGWGGVEVKGGGEERAGMSWWWGLVVRMKGVV